MLLGHEVNDGKNDFMIFIDKNVCENLYFQKQILYGLLVTKFWLNNLLP